MRSPNKNKNKTHKAQMQVLRGKKSPMIHLEASIKKQLLKLLQATSAFSSVQEFQVLGMEPCPWDPLTAIAWKRFPFSFAWTAPPSQAQAGQKYFKLQNFLCDLQWSSPTPTLTNTSVYTALPTTKFVNMHFLLLLFSLSLGHCS